MENKDNKTIGQIFDETNADYIIVGIDETEYWIDAVKEQIINAYGVYIIKNEPTHLCSLNTDYPATHLYDSFIRKGEFENSEYLNESEFENHGIDNNVNYYNERFVVNDYHLVNHETLNYDEETTEEEIAEYYLCNCVI
jgi:hypothetical protein